MSREAKRKSQKLFPFVKRAIKSREVFPFRFNKNISLNFWLIKNSRMACFISSGFMVEGRYGFRKKKLNDLILDVLIFTVSSCLNPIAPRLAKIYGVLTILSAIVLIG